MRFAPQLHAIPGKFTIEDVICSVNRGLERAARDADELDQLSGRQTSTHDVGGCCDNTSSSSSSSTETNEKLNKLAEGEHPYHPDAPNHHYGIIACAMRFFLPEFGPYYEAFWGVHAGEDPHRVFGLASVALVTAVNKLRTRGRCCDSCADAGEGSDSTNDGRDDANDNSPHRRAGSYILPVVAIDIAGAESGYPASDHREAFDLAHQSFLNKTVHAGEAYGPESIFEAITDLHAERIGHGCNLFRWDVIGEGEGRGGKARKVRDEEGMNDDEKRKYVENLTRYLGVSAISLSSNRAVSSCSQFN